MDYQSIIDKIKSDFQTVLNHFKEELMKIRASRISPNLIEDLKIECFGSMCPLKQLGAISSVSFREVAIQLWDKSYVEGVQRALEKGGWGFGIRVDEKTIYLTAPALTEEIRKELINILHHKKEQTIQDIRRLRDKAWRQIQDGFQGGEIREDDKFKGRDKLDEAVKEEKEKIEELAVSKEKEIRG